MYSVMMDWVVPGQEAEKGNGGEHKILSNLVFMDLILISILKTLRVEITN